ncbi:MAG: hypothetical protein ACTHK0_14460, partial [Ginsengibacter sp.]
IFSSFLSLLLIFHDHSTYFKISINHCLVYASYTVCLADCISSAIFEYRFLLVSSVFISEVFWFTTFRFGID